MDKNKITDYKNKILDYLKTLGIESVEQLNQNSIDLWWERKKIEIRSSNETKNQIKQNINKINEAKDFLDRIDLKNIKSSLYEKEGGRKAEKTRKFVRNSIINYPKEEFREWREVDNLFYGNFGEHIMDEDNYSTFEKPTMDSGQYWYIKDHVEFNKLLDDIKEIVRFEEKRTLEELIYLLSFIFEEKITLFIGMDIQCDDDSSAYGAIYYYHNSIVINSDYIMEIDFMCETLTHELIHYLQSNGNQCKPLKIDIEDSIVPKISRIYSNNHDDNLRIELEAGTFDRFPNFIKKFKEDKKRFLISPQRDRTIDWICKNKRLPIYDSPFLFSQEKFFQFNFANGEIREINAI